ncbi:hypothetical protein SDC9_165812 [bioreactor metagenome]|uniref:Uncharacterized protein n=1 Tax=bioreactor metagenome TaxID=1076179 RepID=A0A645FXL6_9ZZZZ
MKRNSVIAGQAGENDTIQQIRRSIVKQGKVEIQFQSIPVIACEVIG